MAALLLINLSVLMYNLLMFWYEGGFKYMVSSRMFWLTASALFMLMQLNIFSIRNLVWRINRVANQVGLEPDPYYRPPPRYGYERRLRRLKSEQDQESDKEEEDDGFY